MPKSAILTGGHVSSSA